MESIKEAAIQLVKNHLDINSLLNEISSYSFSEAQVTSFETAITVTMDTLHDWSSTTSQPISLVGSCYALEKLKTFSNNDTRDDGNFFTIEQKREFLILCDLVKKLVKDNLFDRHHFVHGLFNIISCVPLEAFWVLFNSQVVTIEDLNYTSAEASNRFWTWLTHVLGVICTGCPSSCVDLQREILQGISVALLEFAYREDGHSQYAQPAFDCLKHLTLGSHDSIGNSDKINSYSVMSALRHSRLTHPLHLRKLLVQVMESHFNTGTLMTVLEAFSFHELWKFSRLTENIVNFYSEVCAVLDISDCGTLLSVTVNCDKVVWKNVLQFVSCVINLNTTMTNQSLKEFIKKRVIASLTDCATHQLQSALLLARQCALEGGHLFPSYYDWLQEVLGGDTSCVLTAKRSAQFLITTFTDLIPYENSLYLQAHAKFLRKHLMKHKASVDQFMMVALTKLKDLGITDRELSDKQTSEQAQMSSLSDYDVVEQVLKQFGHTKEVPSLVMRMSILHPQRFTNLFLPILLAPRLRPETPDSREEFIQELVRMKKIPTAMVSLYESECRKQKDRGSERDTPLSDGVALAMQRFVECVKNSLSGSVAPSLSVLSSSITTTCCHHSDGNTTMFVADQLELLDCNNPSLYQWQVELIDSIISALCTSVTELYRELGTVGSSKQQKFLWLDSFLEMLSSHVILHRCWFVRLWELMYIQVGDLSEYHVTGLATLLVHMCHSSCAYQQLRLVGPPAVMRSTHVTCPHVKGLAQYGELLLDYVGGNSEDGLCNSLSLLCQMLRHAMLIKCSPPSTAVKKFQYFHSYLLFLHETEICISGLTKKPRTTASDVLQLAGMLLKEPEVINWVSSNKLSLKEWLLLELSNCSSNNTGNNQQSLCSSNRYVYHCHMLQKHFLTHSLSHDPSTSSHDPSISLHDHSTVSHDPSTSSHDPSTSSHDHSTVSHDPMYDRAELFRTIFATIVQIHSQTERANQRWEDSISLLQDQALSLPQQSSSNPVLPSAIELALQDKASSNAVWCSFRVALTLPHHLFFCNELSEVTSLKQSLSVLQSYWAPHTCDCYVLPFNMTRYLYKSLQEVGRNFKGCVISVLLDHCPLLLSSFVVWWLQLKHLGCSQNKTAHFIDQLSSTISKSSSTSSEPNLIANDNLPLVVGVSMFNYQLKCRSPSDDLLCQLSVLFLDVEYRKEALAVLLCCAVYQFGWCKSGNHTTDNSAVHLIETLLYTEPELLTSLFDDVTAPSDTTSVIRRFQTYFPINTGRNDTILFVLYFRLLSVLRSSLLLKIVQSRKVLQLTHHMYERYLLFKSRNDDDNNLVLSLADISIITTIFQSLIQLLPDHLLMETNSDSSISEKVKAHYKKEMQIRNL